MYTVQFYERGETSYQTRTFYKQKTRDTFLERLAARGGRVKVSDLTINVDRRFVRIREFMRDNDDVTASQIAVLLRIDRSTARDLLMRLAHNGEATVTKILVSKTPAMAFNVPATSDDDALESRIRQEARRKAETIKPFRDPFIAAMYGDAA